MSSKKGIAPTLDANISRTYPLPEKFRCAVGGEWKPSSQFSQKQLAVWHRNKKSANDGVTADNIQIVCREHSGEPAILLKCTGPCGQWKARDKFSASQRRNKQRWCAICVQWRLQQDYDSIPTAAPNEANEAADEREGFTAVEERMTFESENGSELEDEDEGEDEGTAFPDVTDNVSVGTDPEDEDGACPSVAGRGHFFHDSDPDEDDIVVADIRSATSISKPLSMMTISTGHSKNGKSAKPNFYPSQRSHHTASNQVSRSTSTYSTPVKARDSAEVRSLQSSASNWIPPHLRKQENLVTLKEKSLTECHIPGFKGAVPMTSMTDAWVPPHLRASAPSQQFGKDNNPHGSESGHSVMPASNTVNNLRIPTESPAFSTYSFPIGGSAQSVASDDSRAGVPTMSINSQTYSSVDKERYKFQTSQRRQFNAFDPQGNAHIRTVECDSTKTSLPPSSSAQSVADRNKSTSGAWARPDRRKIFGAVSLENKRSGKDHVHVYDSGSEDEM